MAVDQLTPKQRAFVEQYLLDLNATQAAIRAGYSADTAGSIGGENLQKPEIQAAIQAALDERSERTKIDSDYVLQGLKEIAQRCMQRAPVMVRRGKHLVHLVDEDGNHVWKFDSSGANRALELLGKNLKLFTDKLEHSGEIDSNLTPEQRQARIEALLAKRKAEEPK